MNEQSDSVGNPVAEAYEYPSLTVLKQTHMELLEQESRADKKEMTPQFLNRVMTFMRRASATGRILDDDAERGIAQTLLSYWVTVLYRYSVPEDLIPQSFLMELDETAGRDLDDSQCPYRGFAAYSESTAHLFFGRKHVTDNWIEILKKKRVLVVLGASGAGKTSLIRAGLLPALKANRVPGSNKWEVTEITLSWENPREVLLSAMKEVADRTRALLVIHRLDEFFFSSDRAVRRELMDAVHKWVTKPDTDRHVVISARSRSAGVLNNVIRECNLDKVGRTEFIPPFDARELRAVIEKPADQIGLRFDEGLVDTLINDFLGDPAALALLQFMLLKLWDARERNHITWKAYEECGGGSRVVEQAAESVFKAVEFDDRNRNLTKKIFLQLVHPSLTSELVAETVPVSALASSPNKRSGEWNRVEKILRRFEEAGLLRIKWDLKDPLVEVSHEALLRKWPRMLEWIEDSRFELLQKQRLSVAAQQWREAGRDRSALWSGVLLAATDSIREALSAEELEFVDASKKAAEWRRRRNRILIAAVFAILCFLFAREFYSSRKTEAALNLERAERLVEAGDPAGALIFFQQAKSADFDPFYISSKRHKLRLGTTLRQLPRLLDLYHLPELIWAQLSPDETFLLGAARKGPIRMWRLDKDGRSEGLDLLSDPLHGTVNSVAIHPDPKFPLVAAVVSSSESEGGKIAGGKVLVFDVKTGKQPRSINFADRVPHQVQFHPTNPKLLLISSHDPKGAEADDVGVWNYETGVCKSHFAQNGNGTSGVPLNWIAFSSDGALVVIVGGELSDATGKANGKAWVWNWNSGNEIELPHDGGPIEYAEFESPPDWNLKSGETEVAVTQDRGKVRQLRFVTAEQSNGGTSGAVRVWSVHDSPSNLQISALTRPFLHRGAVRRAHFSPDGSFIASASRDHTARLWHIETQKEVLSFRHDGDVFDVAFSPDGRLLATGGRDRTARIWEVATGQLVMPPLNHSETVIKVAFSNDGRRLLTTSKHLARLWETEPSEPFSPLLDLDSPILSAVSGDGQRLLTVDREEGQEEEEESVELWDSKNGELLSSWNEKHVTGATLAKSGRRMAIASKETGVRILEVDPTGGAIKEIFHKPSSSRNFSILAFDEDAERLAAVLPAVSGAKSRSEVAIFDLATRDVQHTLRSTDENPIKEVRFGPNGNLVLAIANKVRTGQGGRALLWNLENSELRNPTELLHDEAINSADFSRDGQWLLTGGEDDDVKLWALSSGQFDPKKGKVLQKDPDQKYSHTHTADVTSVVFSPDSKKALTGSLDQTAILWKLEENAPSQIAVLRHGASVRKVSFSNNGELILTSSDEPALRLWSAIDGELIALISPKGEVVESGFGPEDKSLFAVVQASERDSTTARNSGELGSISEIRPKTWSLKPLVLNEPEKLANLLAARGLESGGTKLPPFLKKLHEFVEPALKVVSGNRHKRKALDGVPTDQLAKIWSDEAVRKDLKLLGSDPREPVSYHKEEANECEIIDQGFAAAWHFTKLLEELPDSTDKDERSKLLLSRAEAFLNARDLQNGLAFALRDLKQARNLGRDGAEDYARIAKVHLELGNTFGQQKKSASAFEQWQAAIEALQEAAKREPKNPEYQISLGEAYAGKRLFKMAKKAFVKAGELARANKPDRDIAPARLAFIDLLDGNLDSYRKECKRLEDQKLEGWEAYALLWPSLLPTALRSGPTPNSPTVPLYPFQNDESFINEVVERAEKWRAKSPSNYYRRNTYGAALYRAGKYEEAIVELETSRALHIAETTSKLSNAYDHLIRVPTSPTPDGRPVDWVFLAMANAKLGRRTEAWDWMRKLLVLPEFKDRQGVPTGNTAKLPVPYNSLALELIFDEAYALLRSRPNRPSQ